MEKSKNSRSKKNSGNTLLDQSRMPAIKKAGPHSLIPKELREKILETGIRFIQG